MGFIPLAVLASNAKYPRGEQVFTTSGTFTVPEGVKQISVVCVGGGAGGDTNTTNGYRRGTGGAGLGYKTLSVTPGQSLSVVVGAGGDGGQLNPVNINGGRGFSGGDTYVIDNSTVLGGGGKGTDQQNIGGTFIGDGGGNGGTGGVSFNKFGKGGGGGAGGYSGSGGDGGNAESPDGEAGTGGGGGGGAHESTGEERSGQGGGVGLNGQGSNGSGGTETPESVDGNPGSGGSGQLYGGAGWSIDSGDTAGDGGNGAVRIIWGKGEVYPTPRNRML